MNATPKKRAVKKVTAKRGEPTRIGNFVFQIRPKKGHVDQYRVHFEQLPEAQKN